MSANIILLAALVSVATCYPTGPPTTACGDMHPHHKNTTKSDSASPYSISVNQKTYKEGDTVMVTVNGSQSFKGFFLQMRSTDMKSMDQIGTFMIPDKVTNMKYVNCAGGNQSAVSHNNNTEKMTVSVLWMAPMGHMGDLNIRATVVSNVTTFWEGVLSDVLKYAGNSTAAPTATTRATTNGTTAVPSNTTASAGAALPSLLLVASMSSVIGFVARR